MPVPTRPQPAGPPVAPPSQSVRPTPVPAEHGGGGATSAPPNATGGKVNLDGSTTPGTGGGAVAPSPGASSPLNLDLHGNGLGPSLSRGHSGLVPLLPGPADDTKTKLGKEIEKAGRADCKDAYQNAGILAVIPLARDAATGKGCKW